MAIGIRNCSKLGGGWLFKLSAHILCSDNENWGKGGSSPPTGAPSLATSYAHVCNGNVTMIGLPCMPCAPALPRDPAVPGSPFIPFSPCSPSDPLAPSTPSNPSTPGKP